MVFECEALLMFEVPVFDMFDVDELTVFAAELTALPAALTALAALLIALPTVLLAFDVLVAVSPQAIPKALNAKSVESAINFFITELILLSSSKINFYLFLLRLGLMQPCPKPFFLEHWTIYGAKCP
jgi:hypothetical protein